MLAGALVFGVWASRSRALAAARAAALHGQLEQQRSAGERREGVLRTVVETTPVAMVLFGEAGSIVFTNRSARDLFFEGPSGRRTELPVDDGTGPGLAAASAPVRG